jgi:hypothetical protein
MLNFELFCCASRFVCALNKLFVQQLQIRMRKQPSLACCLHERAP